MTQQKQLEATAWKVAAGAIGCTGEDHEDDELILPVYNMIMAQYTN